MRKLSVILMMLISWTTIGFAETEDKTPPKKSAVEYIQIEVAPKGSPEGTKASWDKGKTPPKPSVKRQIRKALGLD